MKRKRKQNSPHEPQYVDWETLRPSSWQHKAPIVVPTEVATWEQAYRLPLLVGTERQVQWARRIRHQMLQEAFKGIMEAAALLTDPKPAFAFLDVLRAELSAKEWIEQHRHHLANPVTYIIGPHK